MFFIRWIRIILSRPLVLVGHAASMINFPIDAGLLTAAWRVGGLEADAKFALGAILKRQGIDAARRQGREWIVRRPNAQLVSMAGLMALDVGDFDEAREYLDQGRALGDDGEGLLDLLEYHMASRSGDPQTSLGLARRYARRRDLTPTLSKLVLVELLWADMLAGRLEEARGRAEHLLDVDHSVEAEMALWALAVDSGDEAAAARHLRCKGDPGMKLYFQAMGCVGVGRTDQARGMLDQLAETNPNVADNIRRHIELREASQ